MFEPESDEKVINDRLSNTKYKDNQKLLDMINNIHTKEKLLHLKSMVDQMKRDGISMEDMRNSDFTKPEDTLLFGEYNYLSMNEGPKKEALRAKLAETLTAEDFDQSKMTLR